jgi:hypothetical protein
MPERGIDHEQAAVQLHGGFRTVQSPSPAVTMHLNKTGKRNVTRNTIRSNPQNINSYNSVVKTIRNKSKDHKQRS